MAEITLKAATGRTQPAVWHEPAASARGAAVLLPGVRYTPARPLLHFTTKVLRTSGFGVLEVWYDYSDLDAGSAERDEVYAADAEAALAEADARAEAGERLIVGKSLGTQHLAELVRRGRVDGVPTVWLTPVLDHDPVMDALLRHVHPTLVVAGGQDPASPRPALDELEANTDPAVHVVRIAGADHALERAAPRDAVDALGEAVERMASFVVGLSRQ